MGLIKKKQADNLDFKKVIATLCNKKNKQDKNKSINWKYYIGDKFDNINLEKLNNFRKKEIKLHLKIIKKLSKNHEYPFFVPIFLMRIIRGIIQIKTYLKF